MGVSTFDPQKTQCILGVAQMSGFTDGTFINVEMDDVIFEKKVGADGEVARAKKPGQTATATLTLMSTSLSNLILSGYYATDAVFPALFKEGATVVFAPEAWIEKAPAFERGTEVGDSEWVIAMGKTTIVHGGNPTT